MLIKIKTVPEADEERLIRKTKDSFIVYTKEPAQRGQANKKVIELLRREFKGYNDIKIIKGHHSPSKIISLEKK